jgi:predicted outer membrane repeat protein
LKRRLQAKAIGQVADEPPILGIGQEQLFSFYAPALEAGVYTVTLEQDIVSTATSEKLSIPRPGDSTVTQKFEVVAPRFTLPDGSVHSSFPPQGYGALAKTLPHVVLTDPHLPWDRIASALPDLHSPDWMRNQVPWLALLVFTADELTLNATQLNGPGSLFANTSLGSGGVIQAQTCTINVPITDVPKILSTTSPINALPVDLSDDKSTDLIFVPTSLFSELFTSYDVNGNSVTQTGPDVSRYKYLAHVRDINTTGMADAGVEDNGVFGIVVSHRTGPLSNTQSQPVVAHLVSIEGVESDYMNGQWPIDASQVEYVAMSSLYSWTFVTLPEGSFDIEKTLVNLGRGVNVLRAPDAVIQGVDTSTPMGVRLQGRLRDGYTLTRYRTATGEVSAAIYRGPFTPTLVPYPLMPGNQGQQGSTWLSNCGTDLQIMDPELGIMDITYSVAWQLGKTLAVSDQAFTTALGKLRTTIFGAAMNNAKGEILRGRKGYKDRKETATSLIKTIPRLNTLHRDTGGLFGPGGSMTDRWRRTQSEQLDLSYHGPLIGKIFRKHADAVGAKFMMSSSGDGSERYDEQNMPASTDWMLVLTWVLDKMCLYNVPAHYLIIDPTYLAPETLRFFHVDRNWTDALIDGSLSLGNNLAGVDQVRQTIHLMISEYLYPSTPVSPPPQFPLYGFLLHSEAVTQYPDLKVTVELEGVSDDVAPMLRHENLDVSEGVMICLLDQVPGNPGLQSITFTQPPHQQSFIAGAELDEHRIKTLYKRIFTAEGQLPDPTPWGEYQWVRPNDPNQPVPPRPQDPPRDQGVPHAAAVFKWGSQPDPEVRTLLPTSWANDVNGVLNYFGANPNDPSNPLYYDAIPNSALAGIQLNNPIYQLVIGEASPSSKMAASRTPSSSDSSASSPFPFPSTAQHAAPHPFDLPHRPVGVAGTSSLAPRCTTEFLRDPTHGPPLLPPPHSRPNRSPRIGPLFGNPPEGDNPAFQGPAGAPQYKIECLPIDNDPSNPGIPCGTGIPKDLVFKIVQDPKSVTPSSSDYFLQSFTIVLELAGGDPPRWDSCLLSGYTGPGPFMASNVRFNVLVQVENDPLHGRCLALRVVPRSTTGSAKPSMCKEMTFILPVCVILKHNIANRIPVWITPSYVNFPPVTAVDYYIISFPQH